MEAKHEANRTKEETERQAELEREVSNADTSWINPRTVCGKFVILPVRYKMQTFLVSLKGSDLSFLYGEHL